MKYMSRISEDREVEFLVGLVEKGSGGSGLGEVGRSMRFPEECV
jgi:hypothetical protein